jgi:hypothetical protein
VTKIAKKSCNYFKRYTTFCMAVPFFLTTLYNREHFIDAPIAYGYLFDVIMHDFQLQGRVVQTVYKYI